MLTHRQVATTILRGEWDRLGQSPPAYSDEDYDGVLRAARQWQRRARWSESPATIIEAEGFYLGSGPSPGRCGLQYGTLILAPYCHERELAFAIQQHERSHAWTRRRGLDDATESDAWRLTCRFVGACVEAWESISRAPYPYAPAWLVELSRAAKAA